jgi:hypothetical protein
VLWLLGLAVLAGVIAIDPASPQAWRGSRWGSPPPSGSG